MDVVSIGPLEPDPQRVRESFGSVADRFEGDKLGVLFVAHDADVAAMLHAARRGLGDRIVGATTGGAAFTERGFTRDGVVGGVFGGSHFTYDVAVARGLSGDASALDQACAQLVAAARKTVARTPACIVLGDGRSLDGVALTETLSRRLPPHWKIFGGTAGDSLAFETGSRVFCDDEVLDDAVVLIGMFSNEPAGVAVGHGWSAAEGAKELIVTDIEGHNLLTLDGRPATEVYAEELVRLGLVEAPVRLVPDAQAFAFGAKTRFGQLTIRAPLEYPGDGSIRLGGGVTPGTVLQVVSTTPQRLAESAASVGARSFEGFAQGRTPRGGLVFDCAARLVYLGDDYAAQTKGFFGGRVFPLIGTTSYGEIAKFGGSLEGFHNATAVMAAW